MDLPTQFAKPDLMNLDTNDSIPSAVDLSTISYICRFSTAPLALFASNPCIIVNASDNGVAFTLHSVVLESDDPSLFKNQEWWAVETVLIRLNTRYWSSGRFPAHHNTLDSDGVNVTIGYDVAVCLQRYEPWIVEAYNTSIASPSTLGVVGKGNGVTSLSPSGNIRGSQIVNTRYLNTTRKFDAFVVAHNNSVDQMWKVNLLGTTLGSYTPSTTVGPVVPPVYNISPNLNLLPSSLLLLMARESRDTPMKRACGDTPNSPQTGSPLSSRGSVQLTPYHTLRDQHPSSHSCMKMRRWHMPLTCRGN